MELPILQDVVIIFSLSIGVIVACHQLCIPPIIGFLLTGVVAGPNGLGLIGAPDDVAVVAEIGVILLLFVIGMELSFSELMRLRKPVFLGGTVQVFLTILAFAGLALIQGQPMGRAVFSGFLVALSSTAVVLKLLAERAELNAPHGRITLGILIFQDLVVVPMMLVTPFLAGDGGPLGSTLLLLAGKTVAILAALYLAARFVIPRVLLLVVRTRSRELFLMTTLAFCFSIAEVTSLAGLSLSLGAFLAGLIMSESEYSVSALEGILPFRDVLTSLFFISIGMLLDVGFVLSRWELVAVATGLIVLIKALLASGAGLVLGFPIRIAAMAGLALAQVGEFSFVLAGVGRSHNLLGESDYQLFLAASILTMAVTPVLVSQAPRVGAALGRIFPGAGAPRGAPEAKPHFSALADHLIIVGFGVGGRHLALAARSANIPYVILEMNPDTVRKEAARGEPICYGDAAQHAVLEHVGAAKARVLAIVISDPAANRRVVEAARAINPALRIVVRTRFVTDMEPLLATGANEVIPEEFETSVEIFTRVLNAYLVPRPEIEQFTDFVRAQGYGMLRSPTVLVQPQCDLSGVCSGFEVTSLRLEKGAFLDGKTLEESKLRRDHGITLVAVKRGQDMIQNPDGSFRLLAGDVAYIFGLHGGMVETIRLFIRSDQK